MRPRKSYIMKHEIYAALNRLSAHWVKEMPFVFVEEEGICTEFEGGVTLAIKNDTNFQVCISQRFDESPKPKFQIRVERKIEHTIFVLKRIDAAELELYNQLTYVYHKFIPAVAEQTNQIQQA